MSVEEQIRREYEAGASYRQLAKKYRKSFSQIAGILHPERKPKTNRAAEVLETRLSRVEGKLNHVNAFVKDLRAALENTYKAHVNQKTGCMHFGKFERDKCMFNKPSKLTCVLCPYYVPKWLPGLVIEKMEELASSKPYQR